MIVYFFIYRNDLSTLTRTIILDVMEMGEEQGMGYIIEGIRLLPSADPD